MVYAMKFLRGAYDSFETDTYDTEVDENIQKEVERIINTRQLNSDNDWKALGEKLSGCEIEPFDVEKYQWEYAEADKNSKDDTFLGKFILAALAQKSMVTNKIYSSGSRLAGYSIDYGDKGFKGIRAFKSLVREEEV